MWILSMPSNTRPNHGRKGPFRVNQMSMMSEIDKIELALRFPDEVEDALHPGLSINALDADNKVRKQGDRTGKWRSNKGRSKAKKHRLRPTKI